MMFKRIKEVLSWMTIALLGTSCREGVVTSAKYIYPEATDVQVFQENAHDVYTIYYLVKLAYPSENVLKFYDAVVEEMGFISMKSGGGR